MVYVKQDKMFNMEKSFSFHSVIVPANHVVLLLNVFKMNTVPQGRQACVSSVCYMVDGHRSFFQTIEAITLGGGGSFWELLESYQ